MSGLVHEGKEVVRGSRGMDGVRERRNLGQNIFIETRQRDAAERLFDFKARVRFRVSFGRPEERVNPVHDCEEHEYQNYYLPVPFQECADRIPKGLFGFRFFGGLVWFLVPAVAHG